MVGLVGPTYPKIWGSSAYPLLTISNLTTRIIIFDILSPRAFRKYTTPMVFREFLKNSTYPKIWGSAYPLRSVGGGWVVSGSVDSGCHKLTENVWFVWSKIYIYWHKCSCYRCGTDERTNEQTTSEYRATQLLICEPLSLAILPMLLLVIWSEFWAFPAFQCQL